MPERIQRKRVKGWRMPEGVVYVGRPTVYGSPFIVEYDAQYASPWVLFWSDIGPVHSLHATRHAARKAATECFEDWISQETLDPRLWANHLIIAHVHIKAALARQELVGKSLACWCTPEDACHADVLLRLVNGGES